MAKSKRNRRAKNKIEGVSQKKGENSSDGALVKVEPLLDREIAVRRANALRASRSSLFTMELEEAIEIIARDRVYRAMLATLARRMLMTPTIKGDVFDA